MDSIDSGNSCSSGSELEDTWDGEGVARSLFDDFVSPFASEVYRHMSSNFGFDHTVLGKGTLHRVALVTYLEREKAKGTDVLAAYRRVCSDPSIVLDRFEEYINPPFENEKLIWDFMESSDDEGDEELLKGHLYLERGTKTSQARQKQLLQDEEYFKSYKGLEIHREMVNDHVRTSAYESFIRLNQTLFKNKVVLDVGSGSGILSLFAARAGAKLVVGIDNCENMVKMSEEHAWVNGLTNVRFLHGKVEDSDLVYVNGTVCFKRDCEGNFPYETFKCDILISEWMGYGLLYENMLPSVLFARDKYLTKEGVMVPSKVKLGFFALDMHDKLLSKLKEWEQPKYGLILNGLRYDAAELLKNPTVEVTDPSSIVSDANGICLIDLKHLKQSDIANAHEFEVKVHEGKKCSSLALYFDCIFEPRLTATANVPAVINLKSTTFRGLDSYREHLPGIDKTTMLCTSPEYKGSEDESGVIVIMTTRPDYKATHWKQVLLHLVDHDDAPVQIEGTFEGRVSLINNSANNRAKMASEEPVTDNLLLMLADQCSGIEEMFDIFFDFLGRRSAFFKPHDGSDLNQHLENCVKMVSRHCRKIGALIMEAKRKEWEAQEKEAEAKRQAAMAREAAKNAPTMIDATSGDADEVIDVPRHQEPEEEVEEKEPKNILGAGRPIGNGGRNKWYVWTQTLAGVDLSAKVPPGTTSKSIKVDISTNKLHVYCKGELLFGGDLYESIKSEDCYWTLLDGKTLQINMEKRNQVQWWPCVIKGHPEIDVRKIMPENSKLSELDPETRVTVEKMMLDQKHHGESSATSALMSQLEALQRFKEAHPELDFSNANMN
ncbi:Protein arginine N-methyltransferase 8 [Babesia sp. Xinjiang]|uniref:Protein arginine N-methyltransferase 8 n=1 Tax=Babesia sp. Xinjiang TaxID=462227 RepID=UPI000A25D7C5|nr:Protein arginine N-methyltransferase 8 [Babesia sp. Xinjiang]ORM41158.1 Protein arginine N-methyltransferase 8 [Babesia sp. Xinjiang]